MEFSTCSQIDLGFLVVEMTTECDSGDEIYITQNSFRTQSAAEAVEYLENDMFWNDIDDHSFPEDVVYYDFSNQKDNSSVAQDLDDFLANKKQSEFVPVIGDEYFADDEEVCNRFLIVLLFLVVLICMQKHAVLLNSSQRRE